MRFAFQTQKFETGWLQKWLQPLSDAGWFETVLYRVRSGKEAVVYCCEANPSTGEDLIAAKVYQPRGARAMRHYETYTTGRERLEWGGNPDQSQQKSRSRRKKEPLRRQKEIAWLQYEFRTQRKVHDAGARVPRPLSMNDNVILTSFVGDRRRAAPTLQDIALEPVEAGPIFMRLIEQIALFLSRHRIHGDLSAYNVLMWEGDFWIIDFPQAINAQKHPEAFSLLCRDVDRICKTFKRFGVEACPRSFARAMWDRYVHGDLSNMPVSAPEIP